MRATEGHLGHEDWSKALEPLRGTAVAGLVPGTLSQIARDLAGRVWLDTAYDQLEAAATFPGGNDVPWQALLGVWADQYEGRKCWLPVVEKRPPGTRELLLLARARTRCKDVHKGTENPNYTRDWFSLVAALPEGACLREIAPRVGPFPSRAKEWKDLSEALDRILRRRLAEVR